MIAIVYLSIVGILLTPITLILTKQVIYFNFNLLCLNFSSLKSLTEILHLTNQDLKYKTYIQNKQWTFALYELDKELNENYPINQLIQFNYAIGLILENNSYNHIATKYYNKVNN
uniref:Ycf37 n=1 Tax=Galaxaura rugosa TaxID=268570 RepID=A0A1G4NSZ7_9FLOR|nr:Hypothetical protein ycf37 [Galaxaura rugosa]SCW21686.1 Hypothetical protein ycf37 [Galaxaura rugosa]